TFQSFCFIFLRRDIDRIGFNINFSILDTTYQQSVLKQIMKDRNMDTKKYDYSAILGSISSAKIELVGPEVYLKTAS
ncbi:UvrD-helicase domain-containing protein, partial [Peribacillus sp. N1]